MKYNEFRAQMAPLVIFSLHDARMIESGFDRRRLYEWHKKGYIQPLAKGWYLFADITVDDDIPVTERCRFHDVNLI